MPALGANVTGLSLAVRGVTRDVFVPEPSVGATPTGYGAPILFPFPNRVREAHYRWQGSTYHLPANRGAHAVHGFVRDNAFAVTRAHGDDEAATITCSIDATDVPELAAAYPFAFRLYVTYTLDRGGFRTQATVMNQGPSPMPFGLGFHPYFRAPLIESGRRQDCRIQMWAPCVWEVDSELIPTGTVRPVDASHDPRGYVALGDTTFDTFFTNLALDDPGAGCWSSRLLDPAAGVEIIVLADAAFREAVIFAPPGRAVVSIEPYTCIADAINLAERGIDGGLLVLEPGAQWSAGYAIRARSVDFASD